MMQSISKIWNGRLSGIPALICKLFNVIYCKISRKFATFLFANNVAKCGKGVKLSSNIKYCYPAFIEIGDNVSFGRNVKLTVEKVGTPYLKIGNGVSIVGDCIIDFTGGISIEENAHIGNSVYISTHDHGYDYMAKPVGKPLTIKHNAFIGANVVILHNVNVIGENSVIGTGSVVTKDVPAYSVVAGNPARVIKYLLNNDLSDGKHI